MRQVHLGMPPLPVNFHQILTDVCGLLLSLPYSTDYLEVLIIVQLSLSFLSNQSILNVHWRDWCLDWSSKPLATWCQEPTHRKRPLYWKRLKAGEGGDRGWDSWMASLTQWIWVWANSGRWWRTGKPGTLQSMGSQRVRLDWVTEEQQREPRTWFDSDFGLC